MLTRPGAGPGSSWMRRWSERLARLGEAVPPTQTTAPRAKWFWVIYGVFFALVFFVVPLWRGPFPPRPAMTPYESPVRLGGLPLIAYGETPQGVIAVGGHATGLIAIGGIAVGVIAVGGITLGAIALSGLSMGILALGGGALGWWALGGGAVGYYAFGGLAVGGYAYAGNGVALGYYEASGRQKERLLG